MFLTSFHNSLFWVKAIIMVSNLLEHRTPVLNGPLYRITPLSQRVGTYSGSVS